MIPRHLKILVAALVVGAIVLVIALRDRDASRLVPAESAVEEELGEGVQSVTMAFTDREGLGLVEERRDVVVPEDRAKRAKKILEELAVGPDDPDAVATIPRGTKILGVFFDDAGGVTVDFSRELCENHPGGSTGELLTIRSVVRTLAANFPGVTSVRFIVEGKEIETIAGHLDASVAFDVGQYR